jgi:hypothetical protein
LATDQCGDFSQLRKIASKQTVMQAPAEGIAAVAARIKDRSVQLSSERAVLELVRLEQKEHQVSLDEEAELSQAIRQEFLSAVRARNGVELEVWNVKNKRQSCLEMTHRDEEAATCLSETRSGHQSGWEDLVRDTLAGHSISQVAYRSSFEATIKRRNDTMETRQLQLESLGDHLDSLDLHNRLFREKERLRVELEELKAAVTQGNNEVSRLALEVQEQVAKVSLVSRVSCGISWRSIGLR